LVALLAAVAVLAFASRLAAQPQQPAKTKTTPAPKTAAPKKLQPLDPLTAAEKKTAEELALADARVAELLGSGTHRTIYVEFLSLKSGGEGAREAQNPIRGADVVFFQAEKDFGVRAIVNLGERSVEQVLRLESRQVPMTPQDLEEAFRLAVKDERVRKILGADADRYRIEGTPGAGPAKLRLIVRGLRLETIDEKDPCSKDRCLQLFFRRGDAYLTDQVIVNLTTRQVMVERGEQ